MNLGALQRCSYARAKLLGLISTVVQLVLLGCGIFATFADGRWATILATAVFVAPLVNFWLKDRNRYYYGIGERARRLQVLYDGLGREPTSAEQLELTVVAPGSKGGEPEPLESEFASPLKVGPQRLAHIVQEAAYYTRSLAEVAAKCYLALTTVSIVATVFVIWFLLQVPIGDAILSKQLAKVASMLLIFFAAGSFAEKWRSFDGLWRTALSTFEKCDALRKADSAPELSVLLAVSAYDIALSRAPAIPTFIYKQGREKLHKAWMALMAPEQKVDLQPPTKS